MIAKLIKMGVSINSTNKVRCMCSDYLTAFMYNDQTFLKLCTTYVGSKIFMGILIFGFTTSGLVLNHFVPCSFIFINRCNTVFTIDMLSIVLSIVLLPRVPEYIPPPPPLKKKMTKCIKCTCNHLHFRVPV